MNAWRLSASLLPAAVFIIPFEQHSSENTSSYLWVIKATKEGRLHSLEVAAPVLPVLHVQYSLYKI